MPKIVPAPKVKKLKSNSVRLSCRVSAVTKSHAEQAAYVLGQTVTRFTEEAIARHAAEVLARHQNIVLSERDFAAFVAVINSPAKPLAAGLVAAAADYEGRHLASTETVP